MRTMFDAVNIASLPADATMLAGYVDGRNTTGHFERLKAAHPHVQCVRITVTGGTLDAEVGDIETGDMSPHSGAAWAARKIAAGHHPTLYCNTSTWPRVRAEVQKIGIAGRLSYWVAQYDGDPTIPAGAIAKQFTDKALGRSLDQSIVAAHWPGVDADVDPTPELTVAAVNRGHATFTWTQMPGATSYDFFQDGELMAVHTAGKHTTGPDRLHGEHTFRVLALGPHGLRVFSNTQVVTFP
jgi:hypothetical protein